MKPEPATVCREDSGTIVEAAAAAVLTDEEVGDVVP